MFFTNNIKTFLYFIYKMDFPIEIYTETDKNKNKNNLYYRYYICTQNVGYIECKKYNNYKQLNIGYIECKKYNNYEQLTKQNNLFLIKFDDKQHTNDVFPTYNFSSVCFKICNFIPHCFDNMILKYNLHNLLKIIVKK